MFKERNQSGQSLVEVAIALPLLLLIMAGILDLGRAYFTYVALADAAAEGAAYAAIHPADTAQIIARTVDSSNGLVVLEPDMVTIESGALTPGSPITVTVAFNYQILTPVLEPFVPDGQLTMTAVVAQPIINAP